MTSVAIERYAKHRDLFLAALEPNNSAVLSATEIAALIRRIGVAGERVEQLREQYAEQLQTDPRTRLTYIVQKLVVAAEFNRDAVSPLLVSFENELKAAHRGKGAAMVRSVADTWTAPPGRDAILNSCLSAEALFSLALASAEPASVLYQTAYWLVHGRGEDRDALHRILRSMAAVCEAEGNVRQSDLLNDTGCYLIHFCGLYCAI